jgi:hypothetical protein
MVDADHSPEHVRRLCDWWVGNRAAWFAREGIDLDDPQEWWEIVQGVLATGTDKISIVNGQLLASALFKIAHLEQAAIDSRAERDA